MPIVPRVAKWTTYGLEADPPSLTHTAIQGKYVTYVCTYFQLFKGGVITCFRHSIGKTLIKGMLSEIYKEKNNFYANNRTQEDNAVHLE